MNDQSQKRPRSRYARDPSQYVYDIPDAKLILCKECNVEFYEHLMFEDPDYGLICIHCMYVRRECSVCGCVYPATNRYFNYNRTNRNKQVLRKDCRICSSKRQLKYYYSDHIKRKERMRNHARIQYAKRIDKEE